MPRLTPQQLTSRLLLDFIVATEMTCPTMAVRGYENASQREKGIPVAPGSRGAPPKMYVIDYHIKTLVQKGSYCDSVQVYIDLLANGNYPYTQPTAWVPSGPFPWSPHFRKGSPICIGDKAWNNDGTTLLGHLLIHIAKLLNFDEMDREPGYGVWNHEALKYWRETLLRQPIIKDLAYPMLPVHITHGINLPPSDDQLFEPIGNDVHELSEDLPQW